MNRSAILEGFRNRQGNLSFWRIPNGLFEPRGLFLGEQDPVVAKLNKWRSAIGVIMLVGLYLHTHALFVMLRTVTPQGVHYTLEFGPQDVVGNWLLGIVESMLAGVVVAIVFGALLVAATRPGKRARTARQLGWPVGSLLGFLVLGALVGMVVGPINAVLAHVNGSVHFVIELLVVCTVCFLLLKSLYLVATGLFRADDGHPLLAPVSVTLVAWWFTWQQMSSGGIPGVSHLIGLVFGLGGAVSLTLLSLYSIRRLWRNHPGDRLFRNGPLAAEM